MQKWRYRPIGFANQSSRSPSGAQWGRKGVVAKRRTLGLLVQVGLGVVRKSRTDMTLMIWKAGSTRISGTVSLRSKACLLLAKEL